MKNCRGPLSAVCAFAIVACGGGGGSSGSGSGGGGPPAVFVAGKAAAGAPIAGMVYVKDSTGATFGPVNIGSDGSYSIDVTHGTPPFILAAGGTVGANSILVHSVAFGLDVGGNVNITPLTELALVNAGAAPTLFAQCTGPSACPIPSQAHVTAAQASVQSELSALFSAFGVPAGNLFTTPFTAGAVAGQSAIDTLLDAIAFVPNATPGSFDIVANVPMNTVPAGMVFGTVPAPAFDMSGAPVQGTPVTIDPALDAAAVAAAVNAPKNVSAVGGIARVTISWSAVAGASSYDIYRTTTPALGAVSGTKITGVSSPYTDSGVANGTTYYYAVAANVAGHSYASPLIGATPSAGPPVLSITPPAIAISLPSNVPQPFIISNTGPSDSKMDYLVADNGALGGFLNVQNGKGSLAGGSSATVYVSVLPAFAMVPPDLGPPLVGDTLVLSVYAPQASNVVKGLVSVEITNLAITIDTSFCNKVGTDASGNSTYQIGLSGTATGPIDANLVSGGFGFPGGSGSLTCQSWTIGAQGDPVNVCLRGLTDPTTTQWTIQYSFVFNGDTALTAGVSVGNSPPAIAYASVRLLCH